MNEMNIPRFTAEASLYGSSSYYRYGQSADSKTQAQDRAQVIPQLSVSCGNKSLDTICFPFAAPAWPACAWLAIWDRGAASSCIYGLMVAHAPWCAPCSVTAP
jgi:hypothetical protein